MLSCGTPAKHVTGDTVPFCSSAVTTNLEMEINMTKLVNSKNVDKIENKISMSQLNLMFKLNTVLKWKVIPAALGA